MDTKSGFMIIILSVLGLAQAQTLTQVKQLYTDVFANINTYVVPAADQSQPLNITLKFYPMTVVGFEEAAETLIVLGAIGMVWKDDGISWTPSSYGNKDRISLSRNVIWSPTFILYNSVDGFDPVGSDTDINAEISNDGNVLLNIGSVMSAKCAADVSKFPYDSQTCVLKFSPWNMRNLDIALTTDSTTPVDLGFFTKNSDWDLTDYSANTFSISGYLEFDVTLTIKRESLYYSVMVVCPTILFGLLNPLVFILPDDSGERIGLSITILLSYAIFLTLVSDAIPATSNPMCVLLIIMMMMIFISGVIVVMIIIISALYHRDETTKMNIICKFIGTRFPWSKRKDLVTPYLEDEKMNSSANWTKVEISWKEVAFSLDILSLIVSYVVIIILILAYFIDTA